MVLESWYYTRGVVQRYSRSLRHNSREFPTGCCWAPIPQKAAEKVLEAWNYTRCWVRSGHGGLVLHQGGWDRSDPCGSSWIPGSSRLCSSVQIPQNVVTTELIPTAARGVDTNGLRHLYQGSVGDGKQLELGHRPSLVYTRSLFALTCLYRHVDLIVYTMVTFSHTNAHEEVSAWMAGIPP